MDKLTKYERKDVWIRRIWVLLMALNLGLAFTGSWGAVALAAIMMTFILFAPSSVTLKELRGAEKRKALGATDH
jgi:hypothetical protein